MGLQQPATTRESKPTGGADRSMEHDPATLHDTGAKHPQAAPTETRGRLRPLDGT